ncbi:helix-turn-helix protein [Stackebrandtia albiflava]|uniref:Helix-turn-helix protein n=1 Tax=Stackebrandtia albiflava TaxID=406432 RepID=A0A562VA46_9ACTN|nr:helix-turn-helix transcriptional regulator [Stackebrandtia albiflava]TWJ14770.1 helix-turn-helix protein [Stackebrandtia albiflava]
MSTEAPTIARLALGQILVSLRESAGMDHTDVAEELDVHPDTVRRWEIGQHSVKRHAVKTLADLYGASSTQLSRMYTLAKQGKERGAVERYPGGASPEFRIFADFEPTATEILSYEPEYIPGLLQTPDYLRAVHAAQLPELTPKPEAVHELRADRYDRMFGRRDMPTMRFAIGFAAMLYLQELTPAALAGQVTRLREAGALPTVEVRVVTGMHSGMNGGFTLMTPNSGLLGANRFAYIEAQDVCRYTEAADDVALYDRIFASVWDRAEPLEDYLK